MFRINARRIAVHGCCVATGPMTEVKTYVVLEDRSVGKRQVFVISNALVDWFSVSLRPDMTVPIIAHLADAGWSSLVARRAHNPKVVGSNPAPATNAIRSRVGAFRWVGS